MGIDEGALVKTSLTDTLTALEYTVALGALGL
jgi:hypothetical protein